ncbi:hypothetical protein ANRL4_04426 [Anaerolineae bacterium]|nr:hypothetical protein ANRL4_04426 [Anaerolineae bacterium]
MPEVLNLDDAVRVFRESLLERHIEVAQVEARVKPGNTRLFTKNHDVYHLKFTNKPFTPDKDKQGPARDLHLKLQHAIQTFEYRSSALLEADEHGTMVGIDEDLILYLVDLSQQGKRTFVVTLLRRGLILWVEALDFYNFVMRHDTFIKFPTSGVPVCYVPTGYMLQWAKPRVALPHVVDT